jgi:N6-adenosine-specific RNA methylase IME4
MKFNVIIADPPWKFDDKLTMSSVKRGAESQYKGVLSVDDIVNIDVQSIVGDWGVLALWVPSSMLSDGLRTMTSWGFRQTTTYVWGKTTKSGKIEFGMGRMFRGSHEIALIGTCGKPYANLQNKSQRSLIVDEDLPPDFELALNEMHSKKPQNLHNSFNLMFPDAKKLELFARRHTEGWTCTGNELDGLDVRESLAKLKESQ